MKQSILPNAIHTVLGNNNVLLIIPNGFNSAKGDASCGFLAEFGARLTEELGCYGVINKKYKKTIIDLADVEQAKSRKKTTETFLLQIKRFKDEISGNGLLPLVLVVQADESDTGPDARHICIGYGQGERGIKERPHHPTISPSILARYRVAIEDQDIATSLADTSSGLCGREPRSLNQLFRQKNYLEGFYDPEVRSLLLTLTPDLVRDAETARKTADSLAEAFSQFTQEMSLVRRISTDNIDTLDEEDLQYIFRIHNDPRYNELARESYIDELASSIEKNGLLHPLVLLQKKDGRYRILCGFRRFQALKRIRREWVEAKIFEEQDFSTEDFFNISLAENTKRKNLNPIEIGNFLDTASKTLQLNNTMLAERFGGTLGIGAPGQKVSHSTIHKYRKVNQIRSRGESPEIINDVINEKLQFSIAAEVLAPLKDPRDRDCLYLEIIKPLSPTRPQLKTILSLLRSNQATLAESINSEPVRRAIADAMESSQKAGTFIRLIKQLSPSSGGRKQSGFNRQVSALRKTYFGEGADGNDFNLKPDKKGGRSGQYRLNVRLSKENYHDILQTVEKLLSEGELLK